MIIINIGTERERERDMQRTPTRERKKARWNTREGTNSGPNYTKKIQPIKSALTAAKHQDMIMRTWLLIVTLFPSLPHSFKLRLIDFADAAAVAKCKSENPILPRTSSTYLNSILILFESKSFDMLLRTGFCWRIFVNYNIRSAIKSFREVCNSLSHKYIYKYKYIYIYLYINY